MVLFTLVALLLFQMKVSEHTVVGTKHPILVDFIHDIIYLLRTNPGLKGKHSYLGEPTILISFASFKIGLFR